MTDLSLRAHVERLAVLREEVAQRMAAIAQQRDAFEQSIGTERLNLTAARLTLEACEADVRGLALVAHETTGNAKPCAGVSVVMTKDYTIDEAAALVWAKQTGMALIPESVDLKGVRKIATVQPLLFVTVTETPAVRISTDLIKALGEVAA